MPGKKRSEPPALREGSEKLLKEKRKDPRAKKAWRALRPAVILALSAAICAVLVIAGFSFIKARFFSPVDIHDATPVEVVIKSGSGASSIAKKLYEIGGVDENGNLVEPGLITSKTVFKIYVDFTGKSSKLKAGTYILSRNMDIEQIVDAICEGNPARTTLRFMVTEGMTVEDIANKLVSLGVLKDTAEFLELCRTGENFKEYAMIAALEPNQAQARDYALEGYLFPDTYEIYTDESAKSIINRLLYRFIQVVNTEYIARASELGMTVDEVIALASMIEKEAKVEGDFSKVSAVFHNRLNEGMKLQSDAPLKYIFHTTGVLEFTKEQMNDPSLYNTYVYEGLPLGPIANPGLKAIRAALYPDEDYQKDNYLYFCLMDKETGALIFSKTLEEHQANVAKFRPYW